MRHVLFVMLLISGCAAIDPYEKGETFRDCSDCPIMIVVPGGQSKIGSNNRNQDESPEHWITIEAPFAVAKYETSFLEWERCVKDGGCGGYVPSDEDWGRDDRPVINVSWDDAQMYVSWLSKESGESYRLLSESEWEYAARGWTTTKFPWGNTMGTHYAHCRACFNYWDNKPTAPVGKFLSNNFGLNDMAGNVWEWVEDCRNPSYEGAPTDGSAWINGNCERRVIRGGSWKSHSNILMSSQRGSRPLDTRNFEIGFRVARSL